MILLLVGLVASAMVCVIIRNLLKACIALALLSGILAIIMFMMNAKLAAVFELSVCAGLITVIFISTISMTRIRSKEELEKEERARHKRFVLLPVLVIAFLTGALLLLLPRLDALIPLTDAHLNAVTEPEVFWIERQADLVGQIVIVLAGVYGVLIFFKEREKEREKK